MHATDSTTQAATANVKPEHGSAHESPPTFVSTASRSLIMYSAALHACSCIPHIHLRLAQNHQLDIWAACFFSGHFYLPVFFFFFCASGFFVDSVGVKEHTFVVRISPSLLTLSAGLSYIITFFVHYGMPCLSVCVEGWMDGMWWCGGVVSRVYLRKSSVDLMGSVKGVFFWYRYGLYVEF